MMKKRDAKAGRWAGALTAKAKVRRAAGAAIEALEGRVLLADASSAIQVFDARPAVFVENQGQWADASVYYAYNSSNASIAFGTDGLRFQLTQGGGEAVEVTAPSGRLTTQMARAATESTSFSMRFVGANRVTPQGEQKAEGVYNYFVGEKADWRSNVAGYQTVSYDNLYAGVTLKTFGQKGSMKYEFHVAPGADYQQVQIHYEGIEGLTIGDDGSLHVQTSMGEMVDAAPVIYQEIAGKRVAVAGKFVLLDGNTYAFDIIGKWDARYELVLDPELVWSSYLGGNSYSAGEAITVDCTGNAFVTGSTSSTNFAGATEGYYGGRGDIFVSKLGPTGVIAWVTYLGGDDCDQGTGTTLDRDGGLWVTGYTQSADFAGANNVYQGSDGPFGGSEAFVAKMDPAGSLTWATYLNLGGRDVAGDIVLDSSGSALVTGTAGGSTQDAFVAKVTSVGSVVWRTFLGGMDRNDYGRGITVDSGENLLITGYTESYGLARATNGLLGAADGFVAKVTPAGEIAWVTYVGGSGIDDCIAIAVDGGDNVWVTGQTNSADLDAVNSYHGGRDAFLAKLTARGAIVLETYLGGTGDDAGLGIAMDGGGNALVTGVTGSADLPASWTYHGAGDVFVAEVLSNGTPTWAICVGGSGYEESWGIVLDGRGDAWITGRTSSVDFDGATNGYGSANQDAFVLRLNGAGTPAAIDPGAPIVSLITAPGPQQGDVAIGYVLQSRQSNWCNIDVQYSIDAGNTWATATPGAGGDGTTTLPSSPEGIPHVFVWDSVRDVGSACRSVRVRITPAAGVVGPADTTSFRLNISANHAPAATVDLSTKWPKTNDLLTASATKTDVDGDAVGLTFVWKINGVIKRSFKSPNSLTDSFDLSVAGDANRGDTVTVEVTPNDGIADGVKAISAATVANTAPTVSGIAWRFNQGVALALGAAGFVAGFSDLDAGDTLEKIRITTLPSHGTLNWSGAAVGLNQEIPANQLSAMSYTSAIGYDGNDRFEWSGSDGSLYAEKSAAVNLTPNYAPTVTVVLSAHSPNTRQTLMATATRADMDGDPVSLTFVWKVNGVTRRTFTSAAAMTDTFDLSVAGNGDQGDVVSVEVTPDDGSVKGATASDTATIALNIAPTATVALSAHLPWTNEKLTAKATKADADYDPVSLTFVWKVNGVTKRTFTSATAMTDTFDLSVTGNGDKGDVVSVEVTPDDGSVKGATASDVATVTNAPPRLNGSVVQSVNLDSRVDFSAAAFAATFVDLDAGDSLQKIQITSLPTYGTLKLDGTAVTLNQEIAATQLGTLVYTPFYEGSDSFGWNGSDGELYSWFGVVVLTVTKVTATSVIIYSSNPKLHDDQALRINVLVAVPDAFGSSPTGTILLHDTDGKVLRTLTLVNGQASCRLRGLKQGYHEITAEYLGDAKYGGRWSAHPLSVQVTAGNVVDLLAVYTLSAAQQTYYHGTDIQQLISNAVADTNAALMNSEINLSVELVNVKQVFYNESGTYETDLDRLQNPQDGYLDQVSSWRDTYGADLVCLFVGSMQSDRMIGLASLMQSISAPDNAGKCFSVVALDYAGSPSHTLAHELGHNFGARHDLPHAGGSGVFADSYGYRYRGADGRFYHDIMSYDTSDGDVLIPFYSNPNVRYAGKPTGRAGSSDVARTINATAPVVANYRPAVMTATQTVVLPTGTIFSNYPVTLKASVKGISGNPYAPAGLVMFFDGDAVLGAATLSNGKATWTGFLTAGTPHAIRALYQNDDYFGDSISAVVPVAATRLRVPEHAAKGTVVGSAASLAAGGRTLSYAITAGNTDDVFAIDSSTGVIRVARPGRLDYELAGAHELQVTASDIASTMTGTARVVVKLIDVNEAPSDLTLTNYTVMQHLPAGAVVGKLIGTDPDALKTLTYTLVGGAGSRDDARFTILNGKLRTTGVFDYATQSVYKVRLRVTDQGGLWYEKAMVIGVTQE